MYYNNLTSHNSIMYALFRDSKFCFVFLETKTQRLMQIYSLGDITRDSLCWQMNRSKVYFNLAPVGECASMNTRITGV